MAGWKTARAKRPVQILGSLDGIETVIRQLIRGEPLETMALKYGGGQITVPTIVFDRVCDLDAKRLERQ